MNKKCLLNIKFNFKCVCISYFITNCAILMISRMFKKMIEKSYRKAIESF